MTRLAVLGAGGFVGRALVPAVSAAGYEVTSLTRSGSRATGDPSVAAVQVDVRDHASMRATLAGLDPEVVVNLVTARTGDDATLKAVNARAPRDLAGICADLGVRRLVHVTSSTEYGGVPAPLREDGPRLPTTPYGRHRLAGSRAVLEVGVDRGLEVVVLPLFLPYGPRMDDRLLLPRAAACARSGEILPLTPRGATRDLVHIDDVTRALVAALESAGCEGLVVNVCSGVATDNHELVELVADLVGRPVRRAIGAQSLRPWDRADWRGDPSRARDLLNWSPMIGLRDGIARCVADWGCV